MLDLQFAPDDRFLLSVGRDRRWALFERTGPAQYQPYRCKKEAHARLIWRAAWAPSASKFATVSRERDLSVKIWAVPPPAAHDHDHDQEAEGDLIAPLVAFGYKKTPATAVTFLREDALLVGFETGALALWSAGGELLTEVAETLAHGAQVTRVLAMRERDGEGEGEGEGEEQQVATGSADGSVRVFAVKWK